MTVVGPARYNDCIVACEHIGPVIKCDQLNIGVLCACIPYVCVCVYQFHAWLFFLCFHV